MCGRRDARSPQLSNNLLVTAKKKKKSCHRKCCSLPASTELSVGRGWSCFGAVFQGGERSALRWDFSDSEGAGSPSYDEDANVTNSALVLFVPFSVPSFSAIHPSMLPHL